MDQHGLTERGAGNAWIGALIGVLVVAATSGGIWWATLGAEQVESDLDVARRAANETVAVATLRNLISAQAQFQQSGKIDEDNDGTGEYGGFKDLSGMPMRRVKGDVLEPPVLSSSYQQLSPAGFVQRSGYLYRVYLPRTDGVGHREPEDGFLPGVLDVDLCETVWCAYAHPISPKHGQRTFFVVQSGDITATQASGFGEDGAPAPNAGYVAGKDMRGAFADGVPGNDGNEWAVVN